MNNIQIKNEIQDNNDNTVRLAFSVTFDGSVTISDGAVIITRSDWLEKNGNEKLKIIAQRVSEKMLETIA